MDAGRRLLTRWYFMLGCGVPTLCLALAGCVIGLLGTTRNTEPYNEILARWLKIGCGGFDYALTSADLKRVEAAGLNPNAVANAQAAKLWCKDRFGTTIDIGIQMAIFQYESGGGTNMGSCDWQQAIRERWAGNPKQLKRELDAARWLMDHWRKYGVRERNPVAAVYIYPGYGGYISHCGAGEMGMGGFLPTTAIKVCQKGLSKSHDDEVRSCDFWSLKTNFAAIAYWLHAIGYKAELSRKEKIDELWCSWNCDLVYVGILVNRAAEINALVGDVSVVGTGGSEDDLDPRASPGDTLLAAIRGILEWLKLLPEAQGWLLAPFPEDFPIVITSDWLDERVVIEKGKRKIIIHYGTDFDCSRGDPILALADGKIIKPSSGTLMSEIDEFGKHIWIDHGGIYVVYAHLDKKALLMIPGRKVKRGQEIGECGNTGNVFPKPTPENPDAGTHAHIGVSDQHPDEFKLFAEMNPGWIDPNLVLGACRALTVE